MGKEKEKQMMEFFDDPALDVDPIQGAVRDPKLDENYMGYPKYSKEAPFMDPVVRCDGCQKLVRVAFLQEKGGCICGNKRVKELRHLSQEEYNSLKAEFPDFAAVFDPMGDDEKKALL